KAEAATQAYCLRPHATTGATTASCAQRQSGEPRDMHFSLNLILAQMMLGLSQGVFYAMLSLGLAIIFGLLNVINFAHGALYMLGAFVALIGYNYVGPWLGCDDVHLGLSAALVVAPILI